MSSSLKTLRKLRSNLETQHIEIFDIEEEPSKPQLVWAEVNLLALPFAVLDESEARNSTGHEIIKFESDNSKRIIWQWRVWPDPNIGMPTMATVRVLFAFMQLADEAVRSYGHLPRKLEFSLNDVCRRVGFEPDGRRRAMVKRHIEILVSTQCKSKGAFKDKDRNGLVIDTFKYIRQAVFSGDVDEHGGRVEKNFVVFDDPVRMNLESKYIKQIDVSFMRKIASPIGQLLYTKLSHLLHEADKRGHQFVEVDYQWLAERMGIKVYGQIWEAKKQLKQACEELVRAYYIKVVSWNGFTIRFEAGVRYEYGEHLPNQGRKHAAIKAVGRKLKASPQVAPDVKAEPKPIDALLPICTLYAKGGWNLAEPHARRHGLAESVLETEAQKRGLFG